MFDKENFSQIGSIISTHGLNGELSSQLFIDIDDLLIDNDDIFLFLEIDNNLVPFRLESYRTKGKNTSLLQFSDIYDKDSAERYCNMNVWIENRFLPTDNIDDISDVSIFITYDLFDANTDKRIGKIVSIDDSTINTLLKVDIDGEDEVLIPFAEELIDAIDTNSKAIYLKIPIGLIDL